MEADRKAMPGDSTMLPDPLFHGKTTYKVGNKVFNANKAHFSI